MIIWVLLSLCSVLSSIPLLSWTDAATMRPMLGTLLEGFHFFIQVWLVKPAQKSLLFEFKLDNDFPCCDNILFLRAGQIYAGLRCFKTLTN